MAAATAAEVVDAEAAEAKAAEAGQRRARGPGDGMGGCCRGVDLGRRGGKGGWTRSSERKGRRPIAHSDHRGFSYIGVH